ncbi:hypothetical protein BDK51DRAFT_46148, partial [Blyttiomyces helicus]
MTARKSRIGSATPKPKPKAQSFFSSAGAAPAVVPFPLKPWGSLRPASPTNPFAPAATAANVHEKEFEFNAPHFHDFLAEKSIDPEADKWFDVRAVTPASEFNDDRGADAAGDENEEEFIVNSAGPTPKASFSFFLPLDNKPEGTGSNIEAREKDKSDTPAENEDEDTPRAVPKPASFFIPSDGLKSTKNRDHFAATKAKLASDGRDGRATSTAMTTTFTTRSVKPLTMPVEFNFSKRFRTQKDPLGRKSPGGVL